MVSGSTIRNFFIGIGGFIVLVLLLPTLTPFFTSQSQTLGGVPGALALVALPVILLSLLYGMYQTARSDGVRRR
jgi:hypothetical protein